MLSVYPHSRYLAGLLRAHLVDPAQPFVGAEVGFQDPAAIPRERHVAAGLAFPRREHIRPVLLLGHHRELVT